MTKIIPSLFDNVNTVCEPRLIIVAGQPGCGKTYFINWLKNQLSDVISAEYDDFKLFYPKFDEVAHKYPEISHHLTHYDIRKFLYEVLDNAKERRCNVIMGGSLVDIDGYSNIASSFKDMGYKIELNLFAVSKLESCLSIHERYEAAISNGKIARWISLKDHDQSYNDLIDNANKLKEKNVCDNILIYMRTNKDPKLIYNNNETGHSLSTALEYGRYLNLVECLQNFEERYEQIKQAMNKRETSSFEYEQLELIYDLYQEILDNNIKLKTYVK